MRYNKVWFGAEGRGSIIFLITFTEGASVKLMVGRERQNGPWLGYHRFLLFLPTFSMFSWINISSFVIFPETVNNYVCVFLCFCFQNSYCQICFLLWWVSFLELFTLTFHYNIVFQSVCNTLHSHQSKFFYILSLWSVFLILVIPLGV